MNSTAYPNSGTPFIPVYMVQPVQSNNAEQSGASKPLTSGDGPQQGNPAVVQMAYQSGAQPVLIPVAYPPQTYGPVNPMPDE